MLRAASLTRTCHSVNLCCDNWGKNASVCSLSCGPFCSKQVAGFLSLVIWTSLVCAVCTAMTALTVSTTVATCSSPFWDTKYLSHLSHQPNWHLRRTCKAPRAHSKSAWTCKAGLWSWMCIQSYAHKMLKNQKSTGKCIRSILVNLQRPLALQPFPHLDLSPRVPNIAQAMRGHTGSGNLCSRFQWHRWGNTYINLHISVLTLLCVYLCHQATPRSCQSLKARHIWGFGAKPAALCQSAVTSSPQEEMVWIPPMLSQLFCQGTQSGCHLLVTQPSTTDSGEPVAAGNTQRQIWLNLVAALTA